MKLEEAKTREEKTCRKYYVSLHYAITYSSKSTKHLFPYCFHWVTFQAAFDCPSCGQTDIPLLVPSPLFLCYNFALFPVFWLYLVVYVKVGWGSGTLFLLFFQTWSYFSLFQSGKIIVNSYFLYIKVSSRKSIFLSC